MVDIRGFFDYNDKLFIVIKPGFLSRSSDILSIYQKNGFEVLKTRAKRLTLNEAKRLYYAHKDEDFYNALCKYMTSDVCFGVLLQKSDKKQLVLKDNKELKDIKDKIRKRWSESDMRNVMHSSDDLEHMIREARIFF